MIHLSIISQAIVKKIRKKERKEFSRSLSRGAYSLNEHLIVWIISSYAMTTESILTISRKLFRKEEFSSIFSLAKSSPYPSQVSTRPVSPNPSSIGFYSHSDNPSYSQEKLQLRKLNDQFLSYIERVRVFETYNHCLTLHCEHIQNAQTRTKTKLDHLQQEFDEYQQDKCEREKKDLQLESKNIHQNEEQLNSLKNKQSFCQHEHEAHRKQIIDLQKQSIDLQVHRAFLRNHIEKDRFSLG